MMGNKKNNPGNPSNPDNLNDRDLLIQLWYKVGKLEGTQKITVFLLTGIIIAIIGIFARGC